MQDPISAFITADNNWQQKLLDAFGMRANETRLCLPGRGEPGSELRGAYDRREAARDAFNATMQN